MKAIVVLGAAVWADGPSPTLMRRCAHAAKVWHAGGFSAVVVCGGLGRHPPAEAVVMADELARSGVPREIIQLEDRSTTTLENLTYAREILSQMDINQITIVTDRYHGPRARMVAKVLGLGANVSSPANTGARLVRTKQTLREAIALPGYAGKLAIRKLKGDL